MGTRDNPGQFDCYKQALPDEPMFILLARDPDFARLVNEWATQRERMIECGERPTSDRQMVIEARATAAAGAEWRKTHMASWRANQREMTL